MGGRLQQDALDPVLKTGLRVTTREIPHSHTLEQQFPIWESHKIGMESVEQKIAPGPKCSHMNPILVKRWQQHPQLPAIGCDADKLHLYPAPDCVTLGKSVNLKSQLPQVQHRDGSLAGRTPGNRSQKTFSSYWIHTTISHYLMWHSLAAISHIFP